MAKARGPRFNHGWLPVFHSSLNYSQAFPHVHMYIHAHVIDPLIHLPHTQHEYVARPELCSQLMLPLIKVLEAPLRHSRTPAYEEEEEEKEEEDNVREGEGEGEGEGKGLRGRVREGARRGRRWKGKGIGSERERGGRRREGGRGERRERERGGRR